MCLKENYSDSPSNEYSRHYSAESECLRRQNMNSKLGEEQKKKVHHVRRSPTFGSNSDTKQKKNQNDNGLILGRVSVNTRTRLGTSLFLSKVRRLRAIVKDSIRPSALSKRVEVKCVLSFRLLAPAHPCCY